VCGARGSEAQRAEAAARHQGRSTPGGEMIWVKYRGGLSVFFLDFGGLSIFFFMIRAGGLSGDLYGRFCSIPGFYLFFSSF